MTKKIKENKKNIFIDKGITIEDCLSKDMIKNLYSNFGNKSNKSKNRKNGKA